MVHRFENKDNKTKILYGNDTDVSYCSITRLHKNAYVFTQIWANDDDGTTKSDAYDWTLEEFKDHFYLQYGSPMMYINKEDFNWMTND